LDWYIKAETILLPLSPSKPYPWAATLSVNFLSTSSRMFDSMAAFFREMLYSRRNKLFNTPITVSFASYKVPLETPCIFQLNHSALRASWLHVP